MTLPTSSNNQALSPLNRPARTIRRIWLHTLRENYAIAILLLVLEFLFQPFAVYLYYANIASAMLYQHGSSDFQPETARSIHNILSILHLAVILPLAALFLLILAVRIFGYMHNVTQVDLWHSFPVRRHHLFLSKLGALFTLLLIPHLIVGLWSFCLLPPTAHTDFGMIAMTFGALFYRGLIVLFAGTALLLLCFVSFGSSFEGIAGCLALLTTVPLSARLILLLTSMTLPGVNDHYLTSMPVTKTFLNIISPVGGFSLPFYWLPVGAALMILAVFLYGRRKSEQAETLSVRHPLYKIIRLLSSITGGLMMGTLLGSIFSGSHQGNIFAPLGMLIGSLLTHSIVEMIASRGVRTYLASLKSYLVAVAVLILVFAGISMDVFGVTRAEPAPAAAETVILTASGDAASLPALILSSGENADTIQLISDMDQAVIQSHRNQIGGFTVAGKSAFQSRLDTQTCHYTVTFLMSGSRQITREYSISWERAPELRSRFLADPVLKLYAEPLVQPDDATLDAITVTRDPFNNSNGVSDEKPVSLSRAQKAHLLELYADDSTGEPYRDASIDSKWNDNDHRLYRINLPLSYLSSRLSGKWMTKSRFLQFQNQGWDLNQDLNNNLEPEENEPNAGIDIFVDHWSRQAHAYLTELDPAR